MNIVEKNVIEMDKLEKYIDIFKALGDNTRFKIVLLIISSNNNVCVTAIANQLSVSQPAVSQHLKILKHAGIVISKKMGYHSHYSINLNVIDEISDFINNLKAISSQKTCHSKCK